MSGPPLATDTPSEIEAIQIAHRYPAASEREQFLRRAILLYGPDLAARAYPDIDTLTLE